MTGMVGLIFSFVLLAETRSFTKTMVIGFLLIQLSMRVWGKWGIDIVAPCLRI